MRGALFIPELRELLEARQYETIREVLTDLHPADGAELVSGLHPHEIMEILANIENRTSVEIFEHLDLAVQKACIEQAAPKAMLPLIEGMSSDDRVDLIKQVEPEIADRLMPLLAQAERDDIRRLLVYEEGTAGAIMTTEYASVGMDITASEALSRLRTQAPNKETVYYVYVVDYVIDQAQRLVGIITVDDILDVVEEEATEDIYHLAAAGKPVDYLKTGIFKIAKERILWLFVLVLTGFVAGEVMHQFQGQLLTVIALVFFIPVLSATGGNAGTQTTTVVIRGLATGELEIKDIVRVLSKEIRIALCVGLAMGILASLRAVLTTHDPQLMGPLSLTVGLAMLGCVVLAISAGALLPILFKRVGLDPALMSGPFISSLMDVFTLLLYLKLAGAIIPS